MQPQPKTLAAAAREALLTQARELERFWHTPALRLPMLCVWTASFGGALHYPCLLYTSPSPRDKRQSRMPSSA